MRTSFQWKVSDDIMASPETRSFSKSGVVEMVTRCQSCIKMSRVILAHQVGRPSPDALQTQEIPPSQERKSVQGATQFPELKTNAGFEYLRRLCIFFVGTLHSFDTCLNLPKRTGQPQNGHPNSCSASNVFWMRHAVVNYMTIMTTFWVVK